MEDARVSAPSGPIASFHRASRSRDGALSGAGKEIPLVGARGPGLDSDPFAKPSRGAKVELALSQTPVPPLSRDVASPARSGMGLCRPWRCATVYSGELEDDPQMMCQVADCPNEAEVTRFQDTTIGPASKRFTVEVCSACAAEIDAGRFPDKLDFGREDGQNEP